MGYTVDELPQVINELVRRKPTTTHIVVYEKWVKFSGVVELNLMYVLGEIDKPEYAMRLLRLPEEKP